MSRLADYFAVVGYDHEKDRNGLGCGKILQRFPEKDWPDSPFMDSLEIFCQPQGWSLSTERQEPKFFVSVLTDIDGDRHYCAVLCFNEPISITPSKPTDEEEDGILPPGTGSSPPVHIISNRHHSIMYAPKCLVLISSLDYFETFRDCLGIVYTVYMEGHGVSMETLIGNMVGYVQVPHPGGPQVRFSIGAGDRQALQPPLSNTIPVTNISVYSLFSQLGIRDVLTLFSAALTEHKILFHSQSYCRLTEACRALKALLYPFKYSHVYIPNLPSPLVEVLSTPTPYIMGVHSSLQNDIAELMDVIVADLDGGSIRVPESLTLSLLPEPYWTNTHNALSMILHPELLVADNAFSSSNPPKSPSQVLQDKEIRTVFMRMFAEILQGYRSCLTIIRIHSKPVITFHKASFLGQRSLGDNDFLIKVLDCMFFNTFVSERGPPWRACDIWDELYANIGDQIRQEQQDPRLLIRHIQDIAQQLTSNECPNPQPFVAKIPKPTEGSFTRIHQPMFPEINGEKVQAIINEGMAKRVKIPQKSEQLRIVPPGPHISSIQAGRGIVSSSARRLEVMRNCVNCIFENKISDARKTFPAVLRALKSKAARLALCAELSNHVSGNKAVLEHQQFDLVVRLMNCALQDDSALDEHGVAAALLPLSSAFCRKLCTGVIQFAYTCIQEHSVWGNQQFWEAAFYQDVQNEIKGLYLPFHNSYKRQGKNGSPPDSINNLEQGWQERRSSYLNHQEPSALEIAAEQMRLCLTLDKKKLKEMDEQEESMLYSQAIHYANRMVYLRVPLDINCNTHKKALSDRDNISTSITNSVAESDSMDAESGFEDQEQNDREQSVIKFVSRFVDKVCTEGFVIEEHIKALHQMVPGVVAMHIEMLDAVYKESKRLPPIQKPKIPLPSLIPGEEIVFERLRVFLLPDGREDGLGGHHGGPSLIPAEGALFLTNYRLIFKGQPIDPLACELVVVRSMPVASITKEKRVSGNQHPSPINMDQWMNDGLQVRSNSFQLLRVAFDEEVSAESIESMRKLINRLRHPQSIQQMFAFTGHQHIPQTPNRREKDKPGYGTLRVFAKKTLKKTALVAGLKSAKGNKRHKYVFPNTSVSSNKSMTSPGPLSLGHMNGEDHDDDLSIVDELEVTGMNSDSGSSSGTHIPIGIGVLPREVDGKTMEKLTERSYYKDYQRLGLGSLAISPTNSSSSNIRGKGEFRVTSCNSNYQLCRSYPALLSVPSGIGDESLHRLCRLYHQARLPVITWRHPRTKGLLLRGAGFHSKGVTSMLKGPPTGTSGGVNETSLTLEQEKFLSSVVSSTPMLGRDLSSLVLSDSSLSIDSLVQGAKLQGVGNPNMDLKDLKDLSIHYNPLYPTLTPEINRKTSPLSKAMNTLRLTSSTRLSMDISDGSGTGAADGHLHPSCKAALYVLGERAQIKGIKPDSFPKTEFIPVEYPEVRQVKSSFKKLMRACVPSSQTSEPEQSFYRAVENSEWLNHLSTILQCSGNIVNLMNMLGASVMLVLEDGWDFTAQVSSLAQLCLDSYYRTIEGFRVLIEKEWVAFGHRFLHRSNLLQGSQASGFAPFFLQFLDAVHQIQRQFPLSFQFNEYYLRFLAYHSTSGRFRTFLSDCELERAEVGIMTEEDKRGSLSRHHKGLEASQEDDIYPGGGSSNRLGSPGSSNYLGQSVFDYIEKLATRSTVFMNFLYVGEQAGGSEVLRPMYEVSALTIWSFLVGEELRHGSSYDPEVRTLDRQQEEEAEAADGTSTTSKRRIIMNGYDCMLAVHQDVFTSLMEELRHLEMELGYLPQKWSVHWDKLDLPPPETFNRQVSMTTQMVRHHGRTLYKRSTLEMLIRAKAVGNTGGGGGADTPQSIYSHPHRFEKYNYTTPSYCDHCNSVLWGPLKTGMRCMDCGCNCHEKCIDQIPKNCTRYKSVRDLGTSVQGSNKPTSLDTTSVGSGVTSLQTASHQCYEQFSSNVKDNRSHEAYLWKRGALLKNWKQRWFVLDTMKHQLRYYDTMEDPNSKGIIELSDVVAVFQSYPTPGAPKKVEDRAFFDLQTKRRLYNFCAADGNSAQEWIDKIQSCLQ